MVNLLPTPVKEQVGYARRNRRALRYFWLVIFSIILLAVMFGGMYYWLDVRITAAETEARQRSESADQYKDVEAEMKSISGRLTSIKKIQENQAKFSALLQDIARHTPPGVRITSLTLHGNPAAPVPIQATADSYLSAVSFRDALARSERVAAVDIQSVSVAQGVHNVDLNVMFKVGFSK